MTINASKWETFFAKVKLHTRDTDTDMTFSHRVEKIETSLTRQVRHLDNVFDELAKGRKIENTPANGLTFVLATVCGPYDPTVSGRQRFRSADSRASLTASDMINDADSMPATCR